MLGGFDGPYFFGNLAGLQNEGLAWDNITIAPTVAGDLAGVEATMNTLRGSVVIQWSASEGSSSCGVGHEKDDVCTQPAVVTCGSGIIANITFANYGLTQPNGVCGNYTANCTANSSYEVVKAACLGKHNCSVNADPQTFHNEDPCPSMQKELVIEVTCKSVAYFALNVTIPVGSVATVFLPLLNDGVPRHNSNTDRNGTTISIEESGAPVWVGV